jgi:hypothetical protein
MARHWPDGTGSMFHGPLPTKLIPDQVQTYVA